MHGDLHKALTETNDFVTNTRIQLHRYSSSSMQPIAGTNGCYRSRRRRSSNSLPLPKQIWTAAVVAATAVLFCEAATNKTAANTTTANSAATNGKACPLFIILPFTSR